MRGVVVVALMLGALGGDAVAAEVGCVVKGTRALPVKVKAEGESFVFFRADEYRVRVDAEPFGVNATAPLRFRGVLAMPLPGMRIAEGVHVGAVRLWRAGVKLVEAHGRRALVDVSVDDVFTLRTEVDCAALELEAAQVSLPSLRTNGRVKTRVLHVGMTPADASPVALTVTDREHAAVEIRRRQGRFAFIDGEFGGNVVAGWVPASEVAERKVERSDALASELVRNTATASAVAPAGSHPARVVGGATVYAWPGRAAWATTARERREWIADGVGEWVEVRGMGEHVWVRRAAIVEGGGARSSRRHERRQTLARAVQP